MASHNLSSLLNKFTHDPKVPIGSFTFTNASIKQQIEQAEIATNHLKKCHQMQQKEEMIIQFETKKIEEENLKKLSSLYEEVSYEISRLGEMLKRDGEIQQKQFARLQIQNSKLLSEHQQIKEMQQNIEQRQLEVQSHIGN